MKESYQFFRRLQDLFFFLFFSVALSLFGSLGLLLHLLFGGRDGDFSQEGLLRREQGGCQTIAVGSDLDRIAAIVGVKTGTVGYSLGDVLGDDISVGLDTDR